MCIIYLEKVSANINTQDWFLVYFRTQVYISIDIMSFKY